MSAATLDQGRAGQGRGVDVVAGVGAEFGLGHALGSHERTFGPSPTAFGHDGFGGSTGFADPEQGVGFGYVMNQMGPLLRDDPRKMALARSTTAWQAGAAGCHASSSWVAYLTCCEACACPEAPAAVPRSR
jgi:CubicO group peptidase (beta-lactamase class C family)